MAYNELVNLVNQENQKKMAMEIAEMQRKLQETQANRDHTFTGETDTDLTSGNPEEAGIYTGDEGKLRRKPTEDEIKDNPDLADEYANMKPKSSISSEVNGVDK